MTSVTPIEPGSNPDSAPDRWLVIEVPRPTGEDAASLLIEELMAVAGRGVEERADRFVAYLPDPGDGGEEMLAALRSRLGERWLLGDDRSDDQVITHRLQPHEEWGEIWREGLAPRRITPRIVVSPTWKEPALGPGDLLVSIDPGMAFGTAEHPTTRGALRLLDGRVEPGGRIADVGAGSGILAIAAALLGADHIVAVEMDDWSCGIARENAEANGVADRIDVRHGSVGPAFLPDEAPFDGIVSNIECGVLTTLLPGLEAGVRTGGWLILGGVLYHEVEELLRHAEALSLDIEAEDREGGWWTGAFMARGHGRPSVS